MVCGLLSRFAAICTFRAQSYEIKLEVERCFATNFAPWPQKASKRVERFPSCLASPPFFWRKSLRDIGDEVQLSGLNSHSGTLCVTSRHEAACRASGGVKFHGMPYRPKRHVVSADTARCVCQHGTLCFTSGAEADGAGAFQPDGLGVELLGGSPHVGGLDSLIK